MSNVFPQNHISSPKQHINPILIIIVIGPSYAKCPIICSFYTFPWGGEKCGCTCIVGGNQGLRPRLYLCLMLYDSKTFPLLLLLSRYLAKQTLAMCPGFQQ